MNFLNKVPFFFIWVLGFVSFDFSAKRHAEAGRIREKYPDRIPVRIEH